MGLKKEIKNVSDEKVLNVIGELKKEGTKVTMEKSREDTWNLTVEYDEPEVALSKPESYEEWWEE